jgi:hypothetical protein
MSRSACGRPYLRAGTDPEKVRSEVIRRDERAREGIEKEEEGG